MILKNGKTLVALGLTLTLATVLGLFAYRSSAANTGALMYVQGPTTTTCQQTSITMPAGYQGSNFGLELQQFWPNEPVSISFTFPDGRVLSPVVTSINDLNSLQDPVTALSFNGVPIPINGLDGVIDMPANFPWISFTDGGGDYYYPFQTTNKWPYGCYTFTALGLQSNRQVAANFAVIPQVGPAPDPGQASLIIEDNTTGDPSSQQGALVNIFGRGFVARELISIWITAPDGVVFSFPYQPTTSDIGSFAVPFEFNANHPTGFYAFTALGNLSGYQVISRFNLTSRASPLSGWAQLRVAYPSSRNGAQGTLFEVQGKRFNPYERVDVWMTLPDNAVRGLPSQYADANGEFFADIYLDERLPTGEYDFTAKGADSGFLTISTLSLSSGGPNVPIPDAGSTVNADPAPEVLVTNDSLDTGTSDTLGSPPELTPLFDSPADPIF
ncbi:hypothetical protein K2Z83_09510 [Oscillochloris sp. ZM17-4]|uniref:hypothetical protein n=1 Tax=Oscillochloris sp. ZM17-4 TaxID=2866714 RepID=UPI001C72BB1F|nr:hypothetical protein [Oscillochloris sp. ZM17-4]MBX0327910.1 hypothetical protein [Oscillochloris sp. ZM17-4]